MPLLKEFRDVDLLSPQDFELFVRDVLEAAGWTDLEVTTPGSEYKYGDGGVDIFGVRDKRRFAIEVKQRSEAGTVDVAALNQLYTGARLAGVSNRMLVTNRDFTSEVRVRALKLGVELVNRDSLQSMWVEGHSEIGRRIRPRKYQEAVISDVAERYANGSSRFLIELATGLGKTYTAALLAKRIMDAATPARYRVLFVAHQVELLLQAVTSFKNVFGIGQYSISACFDGASPEDTDFVFASFDTLYSKLGALEKNKFDIVVIDEAHHTPARTYSTVVSHFEPRLLLGLTATPYRSDGRDVLRFFGGSNGHIGRYDLAWALRHNKLAFPRYVVLLDDIDPRSIAQLGQGLSVTDIDKKLFLHKKDEEVIRLIEETIEMKRIESPKAIVFCRTIRHMKHMISFFPPGSATLVHSQMTGVERRERIREFREGDYRYILVCDLFNEGIDIPETNVLVFLRYTGSRTIWLQQLGRGLRKTKNKDFVTVLDFVGSLERIYEIREFGAAVANQPLDPEDAEPRSDGRHHDTSLEVSYSQSAAQVLKLIEDLQYRLRSRSEALDALRRYFDTHGEVPLLEKLEASLESVSCDQIATHFESYLSYQLLALGDDAPTAAIRGRCVELAAAYYEREGVHASARALSLTSTRNGLPAFTAAEAEAWLDGAEWFSGAVAGSDSAQPTGLGMLIGTEPPLASDPLGLHESPLLQHYRGRISSYGQLLALPLAEREAIRSTFRSELLFLRMLTATEEA